MVYPIILLCVQNSLRRDDIPRFLRLLICSTCLIRQAKNLVAPFVYERSDSFALCLKYGRVFWPGTHHSDMNFKIEDILEKDESG